MTSSNNPRDILRELLGSMIAGNSELHQLDPSKPLDEQIDAIHAKQRAEHIANCPECQAQIKARQDAEAEIKAKQAKAKQANADESFTNDERRSRDRTIVGYMAFEEANNVLKPITESFDADEKEVIRARDLFMSSPIISLIRALQGQSPNLVVLPVYAD